MFDPFFFGVLFGVFLIFSLPRFNCHTCEYESRDYHVDGIKALKQNSEVTCVLKIVLSICHFF